MSAVNLQSFRLLMELYSFLPDWHDVGECIINDRASFRLLMELYSFLPKKKSKAITRLQLQVSVSLWSYIHSYLLFEY